MATVYASTVTTITVTLTLDEADLLEELLNGQAADIKKARVENQWLRDLVSDLAAETSA